MEFYVICDEVEEPVGQLWGDDQKVVKICDYNSNERFTVGIFIYKYNHPPLFVILLSVVSITCSQPWSENSTWKIPEINN